MFLMFTVTTGGRSILAERQWGTLPRLLITPSTSSQVIGGKAAGIFLTGISQMTILIAAGFLLFRIQWGDWLAVASVVLALVLAATGWGMVLAAFARNAGEAGAAGNALALVFAAAAGNFIPRMNMPDWLQKASLITPNAWGLDAFALISAGRGLPEIAPYILGLLVMAAVLFTVSAVMFRRQYR
jgi:ABC-2 type transport system permease protein